MSASDSTLGLVLLEIVQNSRASLLSKSCRNEMETALNNFICLMMQIRTSAPAVRV